MARRYGRRPYPGVAVALVWADTRGPKDALAEAV